MEGARVGQYEFVRVLGRGAFGEVWLARDHRLERDVAIKRLKPELIDEPEVRRRFDLEAKTLLQVSEPHVVRVFDRIEIDGVPALVTEYMEGGSLNDLRKSREAPFGIEDVRRWAEHAATGLASIHGRGILHRDIKPANLFLSHDGNLSLGDFGLARAVDRTQTLGLQGTAPYMSPEQLRGLELDARSDLFALGVTLYELLTGTRPFGDGLDRTERAGTVDTIRPGVPPEFADVIEALLRPDPEDRIQSATELLSLLRGDGRAPRPVRSPRRRRLVAAASLAVALTAAALLIRPLLGPAPAHDCDLQDPGGRRVVILPFDYRGDEDLARVSTDLPAMVASRLDGVADISTPPPDSLGLCTHIPDLVPNDSSAIRDWMVEHHARLLVAGTITELSGRLRVDLSYRYLHGSSFVHDKSSFTLDDAGEALPAVNDLGLEVLEQLLREPFDDLAREALRGVASLEAMCAFLEGQLSVRRYEPAPNLDEAVSIDPAMAIAYYVKSISALMFSQPDERIRENLVLARQHDARLSPYGLLLLESAEYELDHDMDAAENALVEAASAYPDAPTVWVRLANLHFQNNPTRGHSISEARGEFERARQLDPENKFAQLGLMWIEISEGSEAAIQLFTANWGGAGRAVADAFTSGTQAERDSILAVNDYCGSGYDGMAQLVLAWPDNERNIMQFLEARLCEDTVPSDRAFFSLLIAHIDAGIGRWKEATGWFAEVPGRFEPFRLEYEALVMSLPFVHPSEGHIRRVIGELERWQPLQEPERIDAEQSGMIRQRFNPHIGVHEQMRLYCLAALRTRLGDYDQARTAIAAIPQAPARDDVVDFVADLVAMGEARIAFAQEDYPGAFELLERVHKFKYMRGGYSGFFHRSDAHYLRALCLMKMSRYEEAMGWFSGSSEKTEFAWLYNARAHLGKAEALEALGRPGEAARHYRRFVDLMEGCDPVYEPEVAEVRRRLSRMAVGRG